MPEIESHGKLFFREIMPACGFPGAPKWASIRAEKSVVRKIIGPRPRRRAKHLIPVNEDAVSMATWGGIFFVWCNDCSAPGGQAQDQSTVGRNTDHATTH
jgi:hypothetical protein